MQKKREYQTWIYVFDVLMLGETRLQSIAIESDKKIRAAIKVREILGNKWVEIHPPRKLDKFKYNDPIKLGVLF